MQRQIDRYEIRRELGRGGMATVYLAFDPRFRRQVAVKILPRQFTHDPRYLARFEQEAHLIATLEHQAIVSVYDFGDHDDAPYLVMRYMPGGTLRDRLSGEPFSLDVIASTLERLAPALDKAHELDIIHYDLKPANILFDDEGNPYLADFGIARLAEATQTMTVVGTPAYMSPEQVGGELKPDRRADIYALGVILYELFTGRQPYMADSPTKQMMAHVLEPVPDVLKANLELPPGAQEIINKTMAKDREDRYATAGEVAAAVSRLAAGYPVTGSDASVAIPIPVAVPEPGFKEQIEPSTASETAPEQVDAGGIVPPVTPPVDEGATEGSFPGWVWWAVALTALVVVALGIRSVMSGNTQSDATSEEEAPVLVEATSTPLPTETALVVLVDPSNTPRPTATTRSTTTSKPSTTSGPSSTSEATQTRTSTLTPTNRPTSTPTERPSILETTPAPKIEVIFESVNFRTGPGVIYGLVEGSAYLRLAETAEVLGRSSNGTWFNVVLDSGVRGWVAASVVDLIHPRNASEIPVAATIPAAPTLTPTPTPTMTNTPEPVAPPSSSGGGSKPKPTSKPPSNNTPEPELPTSVPPPKSTPG